MLMALMSWASRGPDILWLYSVSGFLLLDPGSSKCGGDLGSQVRAEE